MSFALAKQTATKFRSLLADVNRRLITIWKQCRYNADFITSEDIEETQRFMGWVATQFS